MILHKITSLKLINNSNTVEDFHSDVDVTVGDILSIMGIDYQISNITGDKLVLNKPYIALGELLPEQMKIKILPGFIKNQVKLTGELVLITFDDFKLQPTIDMGIKTPGWWYINKYIVNGVVRYKTELLAAMAIAPYPEILIPPVVTEPLPPVVVVSQEEPKLTVKTPTKK